MYKRACSQVSNSTCSSARPLPQSLVVLDPAPTGRSNVQPENTPIPKPSSSVFVSSDSRISSANSRKASLSYPRLRSFSFQGRDGVHNSVEDTRARVSSSSLQSQKTEDRKSSNGSLDFDRNLLRISTPSRTHKDPIISKHPVEGAIRTDPWELDRKWSRRETRRTRSLGTTFFLPSRIREQEKGRQILIKSPMPRTEASCRAQNINEAHYRSRSLPLIPRQGDSNSNPKAKPEVVYCDMKASPCIHTPTLHQRARSPPVIFNDDDESVGKHGQHLSAWNSEQEVS